MIFSKTDVNKIEWLNLVFENRNQSYGAYELRRESGNYLMKALIISGLLFGGAIVLSSVSNHLAQVDVFSPPIISDPLTPDIIVQTIEEPVIPKQNDAGGQQETQPAENIETINYSGNIKPTNLDVNTDIPTIDDLNHKVISNDTHAGIEAGPAANTTPGSGIGTGIEGKGVGEGTDPVGMELLEEMPEFPGGMGAWSKFLSKNLRYPSMAQDANIMGRVVVSFVVEKNGEITNLKVLKGIGAGCDEEAMRVIKKSPFWKPGIQNGRAVRVAYTMPIVFRLD